MCLNNRAIFLSSPGTALSIVYLEHDFNFNSWTISNKIKHHFVSDSYHNAKTASNKYFKWSQSSTPPTPPQLLQFEGRSMDWTCLKNFHLPFLTPPPHHDIHHYLCVWWESDCVIFPPFIIMTDSHLVGM